MDTKLLKLIMPFSSIRMHILRFEEFIPIDEKNIIVIENEFYTKSLVSRIVSKFKNTKVYHHTNISTKDFKDYNIYGVNLIWKKKIRYSETSKYSIFTKTYKFFLQANSIIINIFKIDSEDEIDHVLKQEKQRFYRSVLGPVSLSRKAVVKSISSNQTFIEKISKFGDKKSVLKKSKRYLREISTEKNFQTLKHMVRFLDLLWHFTLDGIYVDSKGIEKVRELSKDKQILYLPSHRSHVDYLLIGYIQLKHNMDVPLVAAGINLSFFPIGRVFRRCGAYFIRRTFKGNPVYSESFFSYLDMLMAQQSNQMFYIEGGRSRSGKLLSPKFGMLNMLVKAFINNKLDDIYCVPLSTDYGKLFEGKSYIDELRGAEKQKESFFAMFDTLKFLKRRQGVTYIQFAEPFSLREYITNYGIQNYEDEERFNKFIQNLGFHVLHSINKVVTITPSAIISLILLSNPKRGIKKKDLVRISHIIYMFLKRRNYRLAINENTFETQIDNVLKNFALNAYVNKVETEIDIIYKVQDSHRPFLDYYKNNIIHLFLPLSYVSVVLKSFKKEEIKLVEVFQELEELKKLFDYEFIYHNEVWEKETILETLKFLRFLKEIKIVDESIYYTVSNSIWTEITSNIILNFLEAYYVVFSRLLALENEIHEKEFLTSLQSYSRSMYEVGEINMIESNSKDCFQNALRFCAENNYISHENKVIALVTENKSELEKEFKKVKAYLL